MTRQAVITVEIEDRELNELYLDLKEAPLRTQLGARKALRRSKDLVTTRMRTDARGHRYLSHFPTAVTSEILDDYTAEIGFSPIPGTQGKLAHIILNGSVNNLPVYDYTNALTRSVPEILDFFGGAGEDAVLGTSEA